MTKTNHYCPVKITGLNWNSNWCHSIQTTFYQEFVIKLFSFFSGLPGRKNNLPRWIQYPQIICTAVIDMINPGTKITPGKPSRKLILFTLLSGKNFRAVKGWKVPLGPANSSLAAFQGFFGQTTRLPAEIDFASRYHEYGLSAPSYPTWTHAEIWAKSKVRNCFHAVKCLQYRSPPDLLTIFSKRYRGMKLKSWE